MAQVRAVQVGSQVSLGTIVRTLNASNTQACQLGTLNNAQSTFYRDPNGNNTTTGVALSVTRNRTLAYVAGQGAGTGNIQTNGYAAIWEKSNFQGTLAVQTPSANYSNPNYGVTGSNYGVIGYYQTGTNYGVTGSNYGVIGYYQTGTNYGATGSNYGVTGYYQTGTNYGVTGYNTNNPNYGVTGQYYVQVNCDTHQPCNNCNCYDPYFNYGITGYNGSNPNYGVTGYNNAANYGVTGTNYGVTGYNNSPNYGVTGSNYGITGYNNAANYGVTGSNYGVTGNNTANANNPAFGVTYYNAYFQSQQSYTANLQIGNVGVFHIQQQAGNIGAVQGPPAAGQLVYT